ncbi:MAG: flagellar biosynthetic protein FliQ [Pseudomonadota bacterium]
MTGGETLDLAREAFWTLLVVAGPPLGVCLVVGLVIALFQALTQVQETTLTFVPKMVALGIALLLSLPLMGGALGTLMDRVSAQIVSG